MCGSRDTITNGACATPEPTESLDTADDLLGARDLYLPAHAQIRLELCSDDFAYTMYLPHQDLIEVAVPDAPYQVEFQTDAPGTFELLGSQMCGYTHPLLIGQVKVGQPPPERAGSP